MSEYEYRKQADPDCEHKRDPADQPKAPGDGTKCDPLPENMAPTLAPPEPCPKPPAGCKCPPKPDTATTSCLQTLIDKQAADILAADKAKAFKTDLEKVLDNAKKANLVYTRDKYQALVAEWLRQDKDIAELIRKLECAVQCWRCILECHVCPLLNDLHNAEKRLYNDGQLYTEVHNLYDLKYWHQQNKSAKQRIFDRISNVMNAWSDPAKTIEAALNSNKALIDSAGKVIGMEPGKAIYDVFLRLVPLHLAIAPPATPETTTKIDKQYTVFCECDQGEADDCCGPDVGEWSLRQRLIGPQPYLIDPNDYLKLLCCLVEQRYVPAKDALNKAEADLAAVTDQIARDEAQLKSGWGKTLETVAKGAIPSAINCRDYEQLEETAHQMFSRSF